MLHLWTSISNCLSRTEGPLYCYVPVQRCWQQSHDNLFHQHIHINSTNTKCVPYHLPKRPFTPMCRSCHSFGCNVPLLHLKFFTSNKNVSNESFVDTGRALSCKRCDQNSFLWLFIYFIFVMWNLFGKYKNKVRHGWDLFWNSMATYVILLQSLEMIWCEMQKMYSYK